MSQSPKEASEGIVVKAEDGTMYFIRNEVLEACRMEGEYLEYARAQEDKAEVSGYAMGNFEVARIYDTPFPKPELPGIFRPTDSGGGGGTIMCSW